MSTNSKMSVAGSGKYGDSGSHVSEKAELVPIKKRRFLYRSCSPPRISSPPKEKRLRPGKEQDNHDQSVLSAPSASKLDDKANLQRDAFHKEPKKVNELPECNDDCLSLLADAACSTSFPMDIDNPEHGSGMLISKVTEGHFEEVTTHDKMESLYNEMIKEDVQASSKIGTKSSHVAATNSMGELPSVYMQEICSDTVKSIELNSRAASSTPVSYDVACEKGEVVGIQRQHSQDERLHWDLNLVMDVWEQPYDCSDPQTSEFESGDTLKDHKSVKTMGNSEQVAKQKISEFVNIQQSICELEKPVDEGSRHNSDDCGVTGDVEKQPLDICQMSLSMTSCCKNNVPLDNKDHLNGEHFAKSLNLDVSPSDYTHLKFKLDETCSVAAQSSVFVKHIGGSTYDNVEISLTGPSCADIPRQSFVGESSTDRFDVKAEHVSKSLNSAGVPSESTDLKALSNSVSHENCHVKSEDITFDQNVGGSTFSDAKMSLTDSSLPDILRQTSIAGTSRNEDFNKNICSVEGRDAVKLPVSCGSDVCMDIVHMEVSSGCKPDAVLSSENIKAKTEDAAQSSITEVIADPSETASSFNRSLRMNYDEFMELFDKRKMVDTSDQKKYNFDISSERCSTFGSESEGELLDGYDSQYEDGELREASELGWEEYGSLDGEAEHVEYQLGNMDMSNPYTDYYQDKVASPLASQFDSEITTNSNGLMIDKEHHEQDDMTNNNLEDDGRRSMASDELLGINRDSSATENSARDAGERVRNFSRAGGLTDSGGIESNAHSRGLSSVPPSQLKGPINCDISFREERMGGTGSRWERESGCRGRFLRRPKFYVQGRARAGEDERVGYSDGRRVFRRQYHPTYHAQENSDTAVTMEGKDATLDALSYDGDQPLTNDDFVANRDRGTGFQPGSPPNEELCSSRPMGRGRFMRYAPQMSNRVGQGSYNGSYQDDYQPSMRYRRPLSQRERSDSPATGRGRCTLNYLQSRERFPSRSGERSPDLRTAPKGRFEPGSYGDTYLRPKGRSPNFRSDFRMTRRRSPNVQAGFVTDRARVGPRTEHLSPPMSKWVCDGKDEPGRFRGPGNKRRDNMLGMPPGRPRLRGAFDGAQNSRPDVFYRSPPARLSEVEGDSREYRTDESFENRRKHFDPPYSSRRGFEHGNGRRLQRNTDNDDDRFVPSFRNVAEFHGRGMRNIDNRMGDNMSRKFPREQRFMYEEDGKFDADLKPFRFRRMDNSRNIKSSVHQRSFRPGRLGEMDGAGRGNRYINKGEMDGAGRGNGYINNYGDRRNRPGVSHPFRGDELES